MKKRVLVLFIIGLITITSCDSNQMTNEEDFINYVESSKNEVSTKPQDETIAEKDILDPSKEPEEESTENENTEPEPSIEPNKQTPVLNKVEASGLDTSKKSWYFNRNTTKSVPTAQTAIDLSKYNAFYVKPNATKEIFLTFDEGYENGYTASILDTLKEQNVKACFFVTGDYIKSSPDLVKRMVNEGHVVGNHSYTHPSFATLSNDEIIAELDKTNNAFKELTGRDIDPFFRPPMGEYSEESLAITNNSGYTTVFWSLAYKDWLVDDQPTNAYAKEQFVNYVHDGAIVLLHAVSSANTNSLSDSITQLKSEGYSFVSLYELYN